MNIEYKDNNNEVVNIEYKDNNNEVITTSAGMMGPHGCWNDGTQRPQDRSLMRPDEGRFFSIVYTFSISGFQWVGARPGRWWRMGSPTFPQEYKANNNEVITMGARMTGPQSTLPETRGSQDRSLMRGDASL